MKTLPLSVDNLVYGGFGPVSFEIGAGECLGIFGESGCGKSRLLRAVADLDPHQGRVALGATAAIDLPAHQWRRRVAYLPAESQWWFDCAAEHFTALPGDGELTDLGLKADILRSPVAHLSSGEKQRLALLRALQREPGVLLLDELTAHLDLERTALLEAKVSSLMDQSRIAVLWVSHSLEQLRRVADRILFMEQGGRIVKEEVCRCR